jgi:hypothetical protein
MKKYMTAAALLLLMAGCKKDINENQNNQLKNLPVPGINVVKGMLSFDKAEFYDTFVSQSDGQVLDALRLYEKSNDYLSLAEQREWAEDTVYTEVISSLLNTDYMIHIENKVYRINAHTGYVYTLSAEYLNDNAAITALRNEDLGNGRICRQSVEEDLWEISGLPQPKSGPGGGCPKAISPIRAQAPANSSTMYSTWTNCHIGNTNLTAWLHAEMRYRRFGIYFELGMWGSERYATVNYPGYAFTCNNVRLESDICTFKRNNNQGTVYNVTIHNPADYTGNRSDIVFKPYGGANRLCWIYWKGRTRKVSTNQVSPTVTLLFHYTE